jgi:hypothetical protein
MRGKSAHSPPRLLVGQEAWTLVVRFRRDEHECDQPVLATVKDTVIFTCRRKRDFSRPQFALLITHLKKATAFENVIDFVLTGVGMWSLLLAGLEAVCITKESIGFEDRVLFHLLRRKLHRIGKLFEMSHALLLFMTDTITIGYRHAKAALICYL